MVASPLSPALPSRRRPASATISMRSTSGCWAGRLEGAHPPQQRAGAAGALPHRTRWRSRARPTPAAALRQSLRVRALSAKIAGRARYHRRVPDAGAGRHPQRLRRLGSTRGRRVRGHRTRQHPTDKALRMAFMATAAGDQRRDLRRRSHSDEVLGAWRCRGHAR